MSTTPIYGRNVLVKMKRAEIFWVEIFRGEGFTRREFDVLKTILIVLGENPIQTFVNINCQTLNISKMNCK